MVEDKEGVGKKGHLGSLSATYRLYVLGNTQLHRVPTTPHYILSYSAFTVLYKTWCYAGCSLMHLIY